MNKVFWVIIVMLLVSIFAPKSEKEIASEMAKQTLSADETTLSNEEETKDEWNKRQSEAYDAGESLANFLNDLLVK